MPVHSFLRLLYRRGIAVSALLLCVLQWGYAAEASRHPVGQVIMQIGQAWVQHGQDLARQPLKQAMPVYEGDLIGTGKDGIIQLKMLDEAWVMIHPDARLHLQVYRYHPNHPRKNRIRLFAPQGKVRWITGKAGRLNKPGFRLNTPVAAIGIRGTDFEALVSPSGATRVRLYSGAVVVAPLSDNCVANAFGPCSSRDAVLLDEMTRQFVIEVSPGHKKPAIKKMKVSAVHSQSDKKANQTSEKELSHATVNEALPVSLLKARVEPTNGKDLTKSSEGEESEQSNITPSVSTIHKVQDRQYVASSQSLQWGRYGSTDLADWPDATTLIKEGWVPVFSTKHLLLFGKNDFTAFPSGKASFNLLAAEAYLFNEGQQPQPLAITSGKLDMDFNQRTFSTNLIMQDMDKAEHHLDARGVLLNNGLLWGKEGTMQVKGTLSGNADKAAYLFSLPASQGGEVEGATYWER